MSDTDESLIPDRETCDKLIADFVGISGTDSACAQFFLQDRGWDLQKSINDYFEAFKSEEKSENEDEEDNVTNHSESNIDIRQPIKPDKIKLFSWNIDGLNETYLKKRTKHICNFIKCEIPDIVFFQEVIPESLAYIRNYLPDYQFHLGGETMYFTLTLTRKSTVTCMQSGVIPYHTSTMGRNLLIVQAKIEDIPLMLINSHLESTAEHSSERMKQLKMSFKYALEADDDQTVIFGGDLNLRDKELDGSGGIPAGLEDLWVTCGSRAECRYTWDMTRNDNCIIPGRYKPRCRFDRLYIRHASPARIVPAYFGLIGIERLKTCQRFPSDHWGLSVHFRIGE